MINKKSTFFLGIFIFLIPFMGFPSSGKTFLITLSGIALVLLSVKISLPKKHTKIRSKKEKITPVFVENIPIYPKDNTVESSSMPGNKSTTVLE